MVELEFKEYKIECVDEPDYKIGSPDNVFQYHRVYDVSTRYAPISHGIRLYKNDQMIDSTLVAAVGGGTGVHQTGLLIDQNQLLICCANNIFCLELPSLSLLWNVQADMATCFQIFLIPDGYIVHGEFEITRLDKNGNIIWQTGGAEIFVTLNGAERFEVTESHIIATDWNNAVYVINFDGEVISDTVKR